MRLIPYKTSPYPDVNFKALEQLVANAFSMRRKTVANNLKNILKASELDALGIDPSLRPEQISVTDYVQIAKFITK